MPFGLSFGAKRRTQNTNTEVNRNETTNQTQSNNQSQTTSGTSNTRGTQASQTTGQQNSSNVGTSNTAGQTVGQTSQTTQAFNDSTLGAIETAVQDLFGTVGNRTPISAFDAGSFVDSGVQAARSDISAGLESNLNQLTTNLGGSASNNSMSALLSNRLRNDAAAEVAGVRANLTTQAEEIQRSNALADNSINSTDQAFLGNLLNALKGGTVTTSGTESQQTAQQNSTQQQATATNSEQNNQQSSQQATQTEQLLSQLSQLLSGNTQTAGTENSRVTERSAGGGFSFTG